MRRLDPRRTLDRLGPQRLDVTAHRKRFERRWISVGDGQQAPVVDLWKAIRRERDLLRSAAVAQDQQALRQRQLAVCKELAIELGDIG